MLGSIVRRLYDKRTARLEGEAESGFTLIELMVVLLIMAILLAIAIPTFLGVKGGAQDRAAQSNLNTALTNAKAVYGNNQTYGATSAAAVTSLSASEPSLTFTSDGTASTTQNTISVGVDTTGNAIMLVNESASKADCWGVFSNDSATVGPDVVGAATTIAWPVTSSAGTWYISYKTSTGACSADVAAAQGVNATGTTTPGKWTQNAFTAAA